jgi:hypothetical protein
MIDIGLVINGERVRAGIKLDSSEWASILKRIPIEKVGFLSKKMLGAMSGEKIFFSKNCTLTLFDNDRGGLVVEPNILGVPMSQLRPDYADNIPRWMPSHFDIGKHRLLVTVFFEDQPPINQEFEIDWSGEWRTEYRLMKKELLVRKISSH